MGQLNPKQYQLWYDNNLISEVLPNHHDNHAANLALAPMKVYHTSQKSIFQSFAHIKNLKVLTKPIIITLSDGK